MTASPLLLVAASLAAGPAHGQALSGVPAGVRAVTVMACDRPDGCTDAFTALADHAAARGIPVLDFDAVVAAGPAGGQARAAWLETTALLDRRKVDAETLEQGRTTLRRVPLTLPADPVFALWLRLGDARLAAGDDAGADEALAAAASSTAGRVHDLPPVSDATLARYLALAEEIVESPAPAVLEITADAPAARVFVDGQPVGVQDGAVPVRVEVLPGWHRVSVERSGRRTAWVGEVTAPAGRTLPVAAQVSEDDGVAALESAVLGTIRQGAPSPDAARQLAAWAAPLGLHTVRFVELTEPRATGSVPEERIEGRTGLWDLRAAWLDVSAGRLEGRGPGSAGLTAAADPDRLSLGLSLGYARLAASDALGPDPHDHLAAELVGLVRLLDPLSLDLRLGLYRSAQPYYLYTDWVSQELVPVAVGARWHPAVGAAGGRAGGPYLGLHGRLLIPYAVGGDAFAGWQWAPSPRWRLSVEGLGGITDQGALYGGGLTVSFSG